MWYPPRQIYERNACYNPYECLSSKNVGAHMNSFSGNNVRVSQTVNHGRSALYININELTSLGVIRLVRVTFEVIERLGQKHKATLTNDRQCYCLLPLQPHLAKSQTTECLYVAVKIACSQIAIFSRVEAFRGIGV